MKVIQVGIGGMGRTWLKTVLASPDVEYAGFVEVNPAIAEQQVRDYEIDRSLIFPTLKEALQAVSADGVIDVTPPQFHKEVSYTALDAGLPVLSEKPLSPTFEDAQAIVNKATQTGVIHMVAQNYRYSVVAQTLKQVLATGEMGAIGAVSVEFFKGPHFGGFREEMDYPLIIDMSIHHFDMMRYFLESDPVSVYGRSWNPPWSWYNGDASASVSFQFENGAVVHYEGSWCANGKETPWNAHWRFDCTNGVVTLVNDEVWVHRKLGVEGFNNLYAEPEKIMTVEMPNVAQAYLLREFYEAVTQGKAPATTCQDNIKSLAMVFNCVSSFKTGDVVRTERN